MRVWLWIAALLAWVLASLTVAYSAPPPGADPNSAVGQWFQGLTIPETGGSCCGEADCRNYPVRIVDDHYQVLYEGRWLVVPDSAVLKGEDNPTGAEVACVYTAHGAIEPQVLCFKRTVKS